MLSHRLAGMAGRLLAASTLTTAAILTAPTATAQVTMTAEIGKHFGLHAKPSNQAGIWKKVAPTKILGSWSQKVVAGAASIEAKAKVISAAGLCVVEVHGRASGDGNTRATAHPTRATSSKDGGDVPINLRLTAPVQTTGKLLVRIDCKTTGPMFSKHHFALGEVTYGKTVLTHMSFFPRPLTKEFPDVTVGPNGLTIPIGATGLVEAIKKDQGFDTTIVITFVADGRAMIFGQSCATMVAGYIGGSAQSPGALTMQVESQLPHSNILLAVALTQTAAPISIGNGCNLLVNPLVIVPPPFGSTRTDAKGAARPVLSVPNMDVRILLQAAILDPKSSQLALTPGLDLTVRKR